MEFSILGALEVRDGDRLLLVRGQVLRRMLAVLLLDVGRVCDVDRLGTAMWDDDSVVDLQVHGLVLELRARLGDTGGRIVEAVGEGYRITADPGTLDTLRFDATVSQARALRANGDLPEADAAYTDALALWRGPMLHGLRGELIREMVAPWGAKRLAAIGERDALRRGPRRP